MPLRFTLDFSGGDSRRVEWAETYYSFSIYIPLPDICGPAASFAQYLGKVEIQMPGRRLEYLLADEDTWSNRSESA